MIRKMIRTIIVLVAFLLVMFFSFFETVSHKFIHPPKISLSINTNVDSLLFIGVDKQSLVPEIPVKIAGYGLKRKEFTDVHDSIFVKSIYLKNQFTEGVILSYDLLIVAPVIAQKVEQELHKIGINNIYFSASHTHSSIGGYGNSLAGNLILGGHSETIINSIVNQTIKSVLKSRNTLTEINTITFSKKQFNKVKNRLNDNRDIEQLLRSIYFNTIDSNEVCIMSTNVHPTIVSHEAVELSNDYPGMLCELNKSNFNVFMAGTMGSLTPIIHKGKDGFERASNYAKYLLSSKVVETDTLKPLTLNFYKIDLPSPKLGLFISENLRMRSWLFTLLFHQAGSFVNVLSIDNLLLIGLPIELSADYYKELEILAKSKGINLVLTTFNGTYLGYGPPSESFDINHRETRETNWFGKYGGDYFAEVIRMIIENK